VEGKRRGKGGNGRGQLPPPKYFGLDPPLGDS